ncbi:DUF924 family protein [Chitinolyticbacter albus]|uniref:DUF924 family protein n=1 Tax=Chitinolyticbacter albus TaxID=2961951 RepID=UPI00210DDEA8|nr:DUF924 family protein [Chitinolyticbacter albus]
MTSLIRRSSPEGRVKSGRNINAVQPQDVLAFWFGPPGETPALRQQWFQRDDEFDMAIRDRFLATVETALAGALDHWACDADGTLALVIVLDQFPRNLFRGSARAFAGDAAARGHALHALELGWQRGLPPLQQVFLYLPFEHAETLADQDRMVALTAPWRSDMALAPFHDYALSHREVIRRFGHFAHRNAVLGRATTEREAAWLAERGEF